MFNKNEKKLARKSPCSLSGALRLLFIHYLLYTSNPSVAAVETAKRPTCKDFEGSWNGVVQGGFDTDYSTALITVEARNTYNQRYTLFYGHWEEWDGNLTRRTSKGSYTNKMQEGWCEENQDGSVIGVLRLLSGLWGAAIRLNLTSTTKADAQLVESLTSDIPITYAYNGKALKA